ncbi:MAG: glycosyltransferase family 4 protein [Thermoanaerobaculia bacterium]|nr:glycosyltransferase family 4 protein [Thermoanaerobaculia bacterium]
MKILHLASFDRWTGAAAVAFEETAALRLAGVEARYAYVGGYLLEEKIGEIEWAEPLLQPGEHPLPVLRNVRSIRRLVAREKIDVIHAHLSQDHWLAKVAHPLRRRSPRIVRTFHSARALRTDMFSSWLLESTDGLAVVNPELSGRTAIAGRESELTPPPLAPRYIPNGMSARPLYGLSTTTPVVGFIGKMSPGRGFEQAIEAFALVQQELPEAKMLIIGHGPHRGPLEGLVSRLGLDPSVIFAGYHEADLAEHFRAMDLMFFTVAGSDEGHRAIIEANGCGTPVVSYPVPGVEYVLGELSADLVTPDPTPRSLAERALTLLPDGASALRAMAVTNASRFSYDQAARRLKRLYEVACGF